MIKTVAFLAASTVASAAKVADKVTVLPGFNETKFGVCASLSCCQTFGGSRAEPALTLRLCRRRFGLPESSGAFQDERVRLALHSLPVPRVTGQPEI